jgi:hypothetical protein
MNHLSPSELVDLVEGTLDTARASHAERCESCARSSAELRRTVQNAAEAADVPEPSPLFWEHFSTRVREAIAQEPAPVRGWIAWRSAYLAIAAVSVVVIAGGSLMMRRAPVLPAPAPLAAGVTGSEPAFDVALDTNTDVWEVLTAAAADLEWDEAREAGMGLQPAAIDRAVQRLSADELNELGRLLQSELKRASN